LPPLITGNKWRFSIFNRAEKKVINAAREMKEFPDLSALIKKKLSGVKKTSSATPDETTPSRTTPGETTPDKATPSQMTPGETTPSRTTPGEMTHSGPPPLAISPGPSVGPINIESSREDFMQSSERETAEPSMTAGNKKKRSAPDSSATINAQARTGSDEPPKKKK